MNRATNPLALAAPAIGLPIPSAWYCLGLSADLKAGGVWRRSLAGQALVVFRGESGAVSALSAWCPHLGSDLSVGGRVEGETIRCGFHGFCFNGAGECTSTPYGKKAPPAAKAKVTPVAERNGLVLAWYGAAGEPPSFEIEPLELDHWTAWREHVFELRGHPQEIAENSVDLGHFAAVHGYLDLQVLAPLRTEGALLAAHYGFVRPRAFAFSPAVGAEITIHQKGLGYAVVEVTLATLGLRTRQLVLSVPLGNDRVALRIAMSVDKRLIPKKIHPLLSWLPRGWLAERIADQGIRSYREDVSQDLPFWEGKVHLTRPALADGDGPIGAYRKWAKQFYGPAQDAGSLAD